MVLSSMSVTQGSHHCNMSKSRQTPSWAQITFVSSNKLKALMIFADCMWHTFNKLGIYVKYPSLTDLFENYI